MANRFLDFVRNGILGNKPFPPANPFQERGVSGTAVFGGYIQIREKRHTLVGQHRYRIASDILTNTSIVAAGVRYFLNLLAKPSWKVEAPEGVAGAEEYAELVEEMMNDMATPWPRLIRRCGLYKFHGFGIHEWTAKKRPDGLVGMDDIESRPQHTIEQWQVDERGTVTGVVQRSPQTGQFIPLPRAKIVYLIDDMLTDSPEGMGWFRHLVEPAERMEAYLKLEGLGFQRDLSGTPIGRAPLTQIEKMVKNGVLTRDKANEMIKEMENFVSLQAKNERTSLLLDSEPHQSLTADGFNVSAVPQWAIELLQGDTTSLPHIAVALARVTEEMARIIGVENILLGQGGKGSLALSRDKSHNMYLNIDSALGDMSAMFSKDFIDPLWTLNGWPDECKPKMKTEAVAFKDVEQITAALRDMATAGAVLPPNDPAINDVRDLLGISEQEEQTPADIAAANGLNNDPANVGNDPNATATEPDMGDEAAGGVKKLKRLALVLKEVNAE